MKRILLVFICALLFFSMTAFSENSDSITAKSGGVAMPQSNSYFRGKNYEEVILELKQAGYVNISTKVLYDIYFGWTDEGEVESVTAGGLEKFKRGDIVDADAPIVVTYHMSYTADPKDRTYNDVVYDRAFYCSKKDGLRSRCYQYYFFNESENKVLYVVHTTAGSGKTKKQYGTYEGSFDGKIIIAFESSDSTVVFKKTQSDDNGRWKADRDIYTEESVKSGLVDIKSW